MNRSRQSKSRSRIDPKGHSLAKRLSLTALSACTPSTTTLFLTYTAELRSDQDVYMFGLDRCYTNVEDANARVELLGTCNVNLKGTETKLLHTDLESGGKSVTWGKYGSQVRFVAVVKRVEMPGEVMTKAKEETNPGGVDKKSEIGLFFAETHLDLAGHVWAVAIHNPKGPAAGSMIPVGRKQSAYSRESGAHAPSTRSSLTSKKLLDRVEEMSSINSTSEERHINLGWGVHSLHQNSDKALAAAKRAWNEHFKAEGRCKKVREHYGFARFSFKPANLAPKNASDYETCLQIRVERVRVMPKGELLSEFSMLEVMPPKVLMGQPPVPALRNVNGEVISTADGRRTSFLDDLYKIANEALDNDSFDHNDLPLAMRIRQEHMARWGTLSDVQRYGQPETDPEVVADMYHAVVQKTGSEERGRRLKQKETSQAYLKARARMAAAVAEEDEVDGDESGGSEHTLRREPRRLGREKLNVPLECAKLTHIPKAQRDISRLHGSGSTPCADSVADGRDTRGPPGPLADGGKDRNAPAMLANRVTTAFADAASKGDGSST